MKLSLRSKASDEAANRLIWGLRHAPVLGLVVACAVTPAQAQNIELDLSGLRAFTPPANYMSLPGYARFMYLDRTGRWISRREAVALARASGAVVYRDTSGEVVYRIVDRRRLLPTPNHPSSALYAAAR